MAYGAQTAAALRAAGHEVVDLSGPDEATAARQARAALDADRIDVLTVVGGDGMVHLGANLCADRATPLAVVAAGTGNDNARELGLPLRDPLGAAALVTAGRSRAVDLGRCVTSAGETRWWVGVLGGGFDSVVNERAARMRWPRGPMRYNVAVARGSRCSGRSRTSSPSTASATRPTRCSWRWQRAGVRRRYAGGSGRVVRRRSPRRRHPPPGLAGGVRPGVPEGLQGHPRQPSPGRDHSGPQIRLEAMGIVTQADGGGSSRCRSTSRWSPGRSP